MIIMATHCGYVVKVEKLKKHPNADRLQIAEFFGNEVCVGLDVVPGEIGVYFPSDLQLSLEFCLHNNLLRKLPDGNPGPGYLDLDKRNVKAINLRGCKSDGLYCGLQSLEFTGMNFDELDIGDTITVVNGVEICCKYIPKNLGRNYSKGGNKTRKKKVPVAPLFSEHADTEQLAYNLAAFKPGDQIEVTLKMHGTSQRTGYLPVFKGYKKDFWGRIISCVRPKSEFAKKLLEKAEHLATPIYDWGYVSGTRRTILNDFEGGYYGSNEFRESHSKLFEGKLLKGESVYYEVVGFTHTGAPIMSSCDNKKINDKEFVKQYGEETVFSYGCRPDTGWKDIQTDNEIPQSDIYVYRITMTNEDGDVIEYTPDFMRYRCEQMGVKCVPMMWNGIIPTDTNMPIRFCGGEGESVNPVAEFIRAKAEEFYDGPDPVGKTHIREGVVVRIVNRPKFTAYKHKNVNFKILEGIYKEEATAPDMEEAEELIREGE
jgi:hypothetical protein